MTLEATTNLAYCCAGIGDNVRARELAKKVERTGQEEALEPMNPYERKIVHDAAATVSHFRQSILAQRKVNCFRGRTIMERRQRFSVDASRPCQSR